MPARGPNARQLCACLTRRSINRMSSSIDYDEYSFFFNDPATTEIYTRSIVGSVRCVQETVSTQSTWVEENTVKELLINPKHPYSVGLINSIPRLDIPHQKGMRLSTLAGKVPELYEIPKGCPFSDRCKEVMAVCHEKDPELKRLSESTKTACWLYN
eukprot:TRINITY_DN59836_c0_g1_i2.p1 TRINITY_DN59836_c0_g1~~TRINITY_DN59836_c0_g1_i2.p1  ORF type:complete len:157 (-),score=24.40 TRINITY_DN59836_c0_g1_i2:206-676(-)